MRQMNASKSRAGRLYELYFADGGEWVGKIRMGFDSAPILSGCAEVEGRNFDIFKSSIIIIRSVIRKEEKFYFVKKAGKRVREPARPPGGFRRKSKAVRN
jgi:hypothetical protein